MELRLGNGIFPCIFAFLRGRLNIFLKKIWFGSCFEHFRAHEIHIYLEVRVMWRIYER